MPNSDQEIIEAMARAIDPHYDPPVAYHAERNKKAEQAAARALKVARPLITRQAEERLLRELLEFREYGAIRITTKFQVGLAMWLRAFAEWLRAFAKSKDISLGDEG